MKRKKNPSLPLSDRQEEVLITLRKLESADGRSPSFRELQAAVRMGSLASLSRYISILHERGYIDREPGKPRSLKVLRYPPERAHLAA
jgi:repressor LexA